MADAKHSKVLLVLAIPFYALYGAWVLIRAMFHLVQWAAWTTKLTAGSLQCPACGSLNSMFGRWECRAPGCGAIYLGSVDRCERCHAGASFFACGKCGASILLRSGR
jgi:predicted RNA-binding Zn-ribbon protein involved in translation (DUF1610 family)